MSDILQAARSYYGLADADVRKTDIYTNEAGQPMLVFEIAFTLDDFLGIAERAKNMQQPDTQPDTAIIEGPKVEAMREAYSALSKAEKGRYGSFARYMAESSGGIVETQQSWGPNPVAMPRSSLNTETPARQVVQVDAPEEPEPVSMDAVWLYDAECSPAHKQHSSDYESQGNRWLIQWAMLTDEQKQKASKE